MADQHGWRRRLLELTSNPALTNFTLPKLMWVRTHEPDVWNRVRHVLLPKDFIQLRLSGEHAVDVADASGTLMFDVARRRWSGDSRCRRVGAAVLPRVFESPEICAHVSAKASSETGLATHQSSREQVTRLPVRWAWASHDPARSASR